jgi:hypothetical protein
MMALRCGRVCDPIAIARCDGYLAVIASDESDRFLHERLKLRAVAASPLFVRAREHAADPRFTLFDHGAAAVPLLLCEPLLIRTARGVELFVAIGDRHAQRLHLLIDRRDFRARRLFDAFHLGDRFFANRGDDRGGAAEGLHQFSGRTTKSGPRPPRSQSAIVFAISDAASCEKISSESPAIASSISLRVVQTRPATPASANPATSSREPITSGVIRAARGS